MSRPAVICAPLLSPPMVDAADGAAFTFLSESGTKNQRKTKTTHTLALPTINQKTTLGWLGTVKRYIGAVARKPANALPAIVPTAVFRFDITTSSHMGRVCPPLLLDSAVLGKD